MIKRNNFNIIETDNSVEWEQCANCHKQTRGITSMPIRMSTLYTENNTLIYKTVKLCSGTCADKFTLSHPDLIINKVQNVYAASFDNFRIENND